jgi:hypothetical protein
MYEPDPDTVTLSPVSKLTVAPEIVTFIVSSKVHDPPPIFFITPRGVWMAMALLIEIGLVVPGRAL